MIATLYVRLFQGKRNVLSVCSVALDEVGVEGRIKRVMKYKKPGVWIVIACVLLAILVAVLFLTVPAREADTPSDAEFSVPSIEDISIPPTPEEDFAYEENSYGLTLTGYHGSETAVSIPETIDGKPVTVIGDSAFKNNDTLQYVVMPSTVIRMGRSAFENCTALVGVRFSDELWIILPRAFANCKSLTSITLPKKMVDIQEEAFTKTGIKELILPDTVQILGNGAFKDCRSLATVSLNEQLSTIGEKAFAGTAITEISIPSGVRKMYESAFGNCTKLEKVVFRGDAPENYFAEDAIPPSGLYTVYYYETALGFTTPTWNGHPCVEIKQNIDALETVRNYESSLAPQDFLQYDTYYDEGYAYNAPSLLYAKTQEGAVLHLTSTDEFISLKGVSPDFERGCAAVFGEKLLLVEPFCDQEGFCGTIRITILEADRQYSNLMKLPWKFQPAKMLCNMRDDGTGELFLFGINRLACLYTTGDGGKTWSPADAAFAPEYHQTDLPAYARFFDENNGVIYCRYEKAGYNNSFLKRFFVTNDGGKSWQRCTLSYSYSSNHSVLESINAENGVYEIHVKFVSDGTEKIFRYTSNDLRTWEIDMDSVPDIPYVSYTDIAGSTLIRLPFHENADQAADFITAMQNDPLSADFLAELSQAPLSSALTEKYIALWYAEAEHTIDGLCRLLGEEYRRQFATYRDAYIAAELDALEIDKNTVCLANDERMAQRLLLVEFDIYRQINFNLKYMLYLAETGTNGSAEDSLRFLYQQTHDTAERSATVLTASDSYLIWEAYHLTDLHGQTPTVFAQTMARNPLDQSPNLSYEAWYSEWHDPAYILEELIREHAEEGEEPAWNFSDIFFHWRSKYLDAYNQELALYKLLFDGGYLTADEQRFDNHQIDPLRQVNFRMYYWCYLYETVTLGEEPNLSLQFD